MSEILTKSTARNIFYGGTLFFFTIFVGLTLHSRHYILTKGTDQANLTDAVVRGKRIWESKACFDCHTILGEGARFAPEVGNVFIRWGGDKDPKAAHEMIKDWMKSQPSGVAGRRQMPQFNLSDNELDDLADFLEWVSRTNTQGWPPGKAG
ncbi:nitric-oxide reductase [Methylocella silvestris BL2]|uniref:Nitric-oxide reductase n=1 Tax=Methylocella silvestris (strain DSM 15510 / CIP 108128 / LMG 27833 / NCIMB 13906 / BL2) TaxID=395965 RepID=B8EHY3_METSB|nr:cytochrome c [Methylocella silvestris]ACK50465.1 nitric-oxide reductase [Methylocella silvestris BL2]